MSLPPLIPADGPRSARKPRNAFGIQNPKDGQIHPGGHHLTLAQRAEVSRGVPSILHKDIPLRPLSPPSDNVKPVLPEAPHSVRQPPMSTIVLDKREVFTVQVMIQRKREEIRRLSAEIEAEEAKLSEDEQHIADMSNELKMTSAQAEAAVGRAEQAMHSAEKKRLELEREQKVWRQRLALV
jgi:uncharacterized membrane protein YccC